MRGNPRCARHSAAASLVVFWLSHFLSAHTPQHPPPAFSHRTRATGGGIADAPTLTPGVSSRPAPSPRRARPYRVLLHNDDVNRREYVVRVLLKVVDGLALDDAVQVMEDAHAHGVGVAACAPQPDAERYCEGLRRGGLISSIEPAGKGGSDSGGDA